MKLDHFLTPYTKNTSKGTKDLNVRPETMKFLEETISNYLFDIGHRNAFLDISPLARETKAKLNCGDYTRNSLNRNASLIPALNVVSKIHGLVCRTPWMLRPVRCTLILPCIPIPSRRVACSRRVRMFVPKSVYEP